MPKFTYLHYEAINKELKNQNIELNGLFYNSKEDKIKGDKIMEEISNMTYDELFQKYRV
jgi:hypothetical protein